MHDQRDLRGHWWLPGNRDERVVGGVLSYHPTDGLELDVFDSLTHHASDAFKISEDGEPPVVDRILGITDDGDRVTLDTCQRTFKRVVNGSEVIRPETFLVTRALLGEHFHDEIQFESVGMQLEALHRWFSRSGLNLDLDPDAGEQETNGTVEKQASEPVVSAQYTYPDSETVVSDDLTVHFDPGITVERGRSTTVKFSETTSIEVGPRWSEDTISLNRTQTVLRKIQLFLALGLQEPVQPIEITGYYESGGEQPEASVEILTNSSAEDTVSENSHPQELLFLLPDIEEEFESVLDTWIKSFEELAPVLNIYFKTIYDDPDLITMYLLRRATLEAYYRTRICANQPGGPSLDHTGFEEPQADYDTIKALLGEETEKSFDVQLEEIFERHSDTASKVPDQVVDWVSEAHSSIDSLLEGTQNSSFALYRRSENLAIIFNIVILSEIGLSPDRIATFIKTN
ncbi:hypothetical protein [Halovivax cerinus]|uniref:ApeA N-terminal domain-containing protein n=1 Tax=Halovivax cerinus TaxID=1487865 RepID=A0ABD5NLJ0_9EURY|nr:hypothetical protein [Halovivax cerinus]